MQRIMANDAGAMCMLAHLHLRGEGGIPQDQTKAMELYARAAELGDSESHYYLAGVYHGGGI
jgi:TPR repeat protein